MATYRYTSVNGKCVVELPGADGTLTALDARSRDFEIDSITGSVGLRPNGTGQLVSLNFPLGYSHDINPVTDTVTIGTDTYAANSKTAAQLATLIRSSSVFLEATAGGGGTSDYNDLTNKPFTSDEVSSVKSNLISYVIEKISTTIYARGGNGLSSFSGTNAATVITSAMGSLTTGGTILIKGIIDNVDILTVPYNNIVIRGEGMYKSGLKLKANADAFYNPALPVLKGMFEVHGINGFQIHDIGLDGNGQNQTWINNGSQINGPGCLSAIYVGNQFASASTSSNTVINNVYAYDFTQYGFYTQRNARNTQILNSKSINNYWNGLTLLGEDDFVNNMETYGSGDVGISIYGLRTTINNTRIGAQNGAYSSVTSKYGLAFEYANSIVPKGHKIINLVIDGGSSFALSRGIGAQRAEDVYIQNIKILNSNVFGAYLEGCKDFVISNSSIKSTSTDFTQGIVITSLGGVNSTNVKISDNDIDFNGFAINLTSGSDGTLVLNNTLKAGSGTLVDAGINTFKLNNYSLNSKYLILDNIIQKRTVALEAQGGATTVSNTGLASNSQGTATTRTIATTNLFSRQRRVGRVGAITANANAGEIGNTQFSVVDGFVFRAVFGIQAYNAGHQYSVGIGNFYSATVLPSTDTNIMHMYADPGDTNWKLRSGNSTMGAVINLGANFPVNTSAVDMYDVTFTVLPGASTGTYYIKRLNTGNVASGQFDAVPSTGNLLAHKCVASNLATGTAPSIDIVRIAITTDY